MEYKIEYKISTFPSSEKYRIFRVFNTHIWQILNPKAYNIDTGEIEYFDFQFDDPVTAEIFNSFLQEANKYENEMG